MGGQHRIYSMPTLDKEGRLCHPVWDSEPFHHNAQNCTEWEMGELFISEDFPLRFFFDRG